MKKIYLIASVLALVAVIFIWPKIWSRYEIKQVPTPTSNENAMRSLDLKPQTNNEGPVSITAAPRNLSNSGWDFAIVLDTHSEELIDDITKVAVLVDDNNKEYAPLSWEGSPSGGHHREGVLRFNPIEPAPKTMKLIIRQIGGISARTFLWTTAP